MIIKRKWELPSFTSLKTDSLSPENADLGLHILYSKFGLMTSGFGLGTSDLGLSIRTGV